MHNLQDEGLACLYVGKWSEVYAATKTVFVHVRTKWRKTSLTWVTVRWSPSDFIDLMIIMKSVVRTFVCTLVLKVGWKPGPGLDLVFWTCRFTCVTLFCSTVVFTVPQDGFLLSCVFAIADYPEHMADKQLLATWKRVSHSKSKRIPQKQCLASVMETQW